MASVIRSARIDPERVVLAMRPAAALASAARVPDRGTLATTPELEPAPVADWNPPAPEAALPALGPMPFEDREAELRAFHEQLAIEREDVLARAQEEGYADGQREGSAQYDEQLAALAALIGSIRAALTSEIAGAEDVLVEIAFESVCKILGDAVANRDGAVAIVRETVRASAERERLLLRVAPDEYELMLSQRTQLLPGDDGKSIEVVADERVALGGCLVETAGGTLDGRLETQLRRLSDTLLSARQMRTEPLS